MSALAVVTGASSGIGAVFARKLAARGYRLLLVARRRDRLEALAAEFPGRAEAWPADLTCDPDLQKLEQRIAGDESLELLVNNAGFGTLGRFFEIPVDSQDAMHRLHILATMRLTHAALRGMVRRNRGGVINVSSVAGFAQSPGNVSYCSTKAWINIFTSTLDLDLRSAGSAVTVQALCPGFTYSDFHDTAGIDRNKIPKALWLEADRVVEDSLRGLDRGKVFVIPTWRYKAIAAFVRNLPRPLLRFGAIRYARRTGRT
ncbi:MAG TPA: SDR family oxidoreductase [Bryobacteraceae bacterium]|nr:SDR family oxidoreductase [Bryobacteraceae bacterium]